MRIVFFGIFALAIASLIGSVAVHYTTQEWVTVTIWDKEREGRSDGDGGTTYTYMVHTEQESFTNSDSVLAFKFNSTDVQRQLREGQEYRLLVTGFRIPVLSMYRNILDYQAVIDDTAPEGQQ